MSVVVTQTNSEVITYAYHHPQSYTIYERAGNYYAKANANTISGVPLTDWVSPNTEIGPLLNKVGSILASIGGGDIVMKPPLSTQFYPLITPVNFLTHGVNLIGKLRSYARIGGDQNIATPLPVATVIRAVTGFPSGGTMIKWGALGGGVIYAEGGMEGLQLDGGNFNGISTPLAGYCVEVLNVQGFKCKNNSFESANIYQLHLASDVGGGASGHRIDGNLFRIHAYPPNTIALAGSGIFGDGLGWGQSWCINNYFSSLAGYAIYAIGNNDNHYLGNYIEGHRQSFGGSLGGLDGTAMVLQDDDVIVADNMIGVEGGVALHGIFWQANIGAKGTANIVNNRISQVSQLGANQGSGIITSQNFGVQSLIIANNNISDGFGNMQYGVYLNNTTMGATAKLLVIGNPITGAATAAIGLGSSIQLQPGFQILNNPGYNLGLLATPYDNTNNFIGIFPAAGSATLISAKVYTCGPVPLDIYLGGGTVTAMTKNGQTIGSGASILPAPTALAALVHLEPGDTFSVTFSVTPATKLVFGR